MAHAGIIARRDGLFRRISDSILEDGFRTLTVGGIAARFHCSRSTLYALAPSKEKLVSAVLRAFFHDVESRFVVVVDPVAGIRHALVTGNPGMSVACFTDVIGSPDARSLYAAFTERRKRWLYDSFGTTRLDRIFVVETTELLLEAIEADELPTRAGRSKTHCAEQLELVLAVACAPVTALVPR